MTVVLTRTTDATVSIAARAETCNAAHADVFLPIYFNAWTTPTPDGSVVLYPYARDIPFADAISQAVTRYIKPYGDNDGGIVLRPDWWLTPTMPVATVESLFITNPHDAALLTESSFRQGLAGALKNGIEAYLPGIQQRLHSAPAVTPAKLLPASGPLAVPPRVAPPPGRADRPGARRRRPPGGPTGGTPGPRLAAADRGRAVGDPSSAQAARPGRYRPDPCRRLLPGFRDPPLDASPPAPPDQAAGERRSPR